MPSNVHERLYLQLHEMTARIKAAIGEADYEALPPMMAVHQELMKQLSDAGNCDDPKMLPFLNEIKSDVNKVVRELELKKGELRQKIHISGNKRKLARAYGV